MATLEETRAALVKMRQANQAAAPAADAGAVPRFLSGAARGLASSPAKVRALSETMRGRQPSTETQDFERDLVRFSGQPEPDTFAGKLGERIGESAPMIAAGAAGGVAAGGVRAMLGEVASEVVAATAGQAAESGGAGFGGQFAAEMIAGGLTPGGSAKALAALDGDAVAIAKFAREMNISPRAARRAVKRAKNNIFGDALEDGTAVDLLEENARLFPDPDRRPSSRQALAPVGGPNLAGDESVASTRSGLGQEIGQRRRRVQQDLEAQFEALRPEGNVGIATSSYEALRETREIRLQELWDGVNLKNDPIRSTDGLKKAALEGRKRGAGLSSMTSEFVDRVLDLDDKITASELQALRSNALTMERVAQRGGEQAQAKARSLSPITRQLNAEIHDLPNAGSPAYKKALAATREFHEDFSPLDTFSQVLLDEKSASRIASRIIGSTDPVKEIGSAVRVLDQTPGGSDALRSVFVDDLFDEAIGNRTPRAIAGKLRKNRDFYKAAFGEERYRDYETLIRKAEIAHRTRTGTPSAVTSVGSGITAQTPVEIMFEQADVSISPNATAFSVARAVSNRILSTVTGRAGAEAIMREAFISSDLYKTLLEMPDQKSVGFWMESWDKLVARAAARKRLAVSGGFRSSDPFAREENRQAER